MGARMKGLVEARRIPSTTLLAAIVLCLPFAAPARAQDIDNLGLASAVTASPSQDASPPIATPMEPPQDQRAEPEAVTPNSEKKAAKGPPEISALSNDPEPTLGPTTAQVTLEASKRYAAIVAAGGWPRIKTSLCPGSKGEAVVALRRRLSAESQLSEDEAIAPDWDSRLTEAVKRFQFRVGLPQTGIVSGATLRELNIPASLRSRQLASTAKRLLHAHFPSGQRYVLVNIPAAIVEAVEGGRVVRRYTTIVGDRNHPSPEVVAKIVSVDLNPSWTVPVSIIKNEVVPKIRKDPNYLSRVHIRVLDRRGHEVNPRRVHWSKKHAAGYTFRQDPGTRNPLGSIRIFMPNKHAVYMHDTPKKQFFARAYRFLSHGCVRVEGVYDLAAWLLEGAPGSPTGRWDTAALSMEISAGRTERIRLPYPVPVIWAYMTGWASTDGTVHFRKDTYGVDAMGKARGSRWVRTTATR
jgi:murein L,D-transpeptidase YcbB/YkuD